MRSLQTHESENTSAESLNYFLAAIAIRRLLNRAHHLLYGKEQGTPFNQSLPSTIRELDSQLNSWRETLPQNLRFEVNGSPRSYATSPNMWEGGNERQGYLRQRYLACQTMIWRPCMIWAFNPEAQASIGSSQNSEMMRGYRRSFDSCLLYAHELRSFTYTVFINSWAVSFS